MLKSFDDFKPLFESGREKLVVIDEKPRVPNGEVAYKVRFIGKTFDHDVMKMYFQTNAKMKVIMDKIAANPEMYFIAYYTKRDGSDRILSENKTWVAFIELINNTKGGKPAYQGFNDTPYNGFVPYTELPKLAIPSDGAIVNASKEAVGVVTSQIQSEPTTPPAVAPPTGEIVDASKPAAQQAQPVQSTPPATDPNTPVTPIDPQYFVGLKRGDKSKKVQQLQRAIELMTAQVSPNAGFELAKKNISSKTKRYDGIWGPYTGKALNLAISPFLTGGENLNKEITSIDQPVLDALNKAMKEMKIGVESLGKLTKSEEEALQANGPVNPKANPIAKTNTNVQVKPGSISANSTAAKSVGVNSTAATKPAVPAAPTQANAAPGTQSVSTSLGKIFFA